MQCWAQGERGKDRTGRQDFQTKKSFLRALAGTRVSRVDGFEAPGMVQDIVIRVPALPFKDSFTLDRDVTRTRLVGTFSR